MLPKLLLGLPLLASSAVAYPGLLHDEPHHTHEVLENIHNTPHCAYTCIFDENMPRKWAPECDDIVGLEFGACLCRADPYQYMLDQCVDLRCKKTEDRKKVTAFVDSELMTGERNERQELCTLRCEGR